MPRFKIQHITKYTYDGPVRDSANQIILYPIKDEYQDVVRQEIRISNDPPVETYKDYYGNEIGSFTNAEPHMEMIIDSRIEVITRARQLPMDGISAEEQWNFIRTLRLQAPFIDFLLQEQFDALNEMISVIDEQKCKNCTPLVASQKMAAFVYTNFKYIKGITDVETTLDEVWKLKAGVCQDFAHILLVMIRLLNIPARYVSGYVCPNKNEMRGEGATHAWVEAYIPSYGWLGIDPTNNCLANELHVRLAVGRNFTDCSPVRGTFKGTAAQQLEVGVSVAYEDGRISEEENIFLKPQPTKNNNGEQNSYRRYMEMMQQQ